MKRILGLMMAIVMVIGIMPLTLYADGTGKGLDAAVDFASEYLAVGDNEYRVFGKNNSDAAKTVKTVRALYSGGNLVSMDMGETFTVAAGEEFAVSESVNVPEGTDISNSYLNIYVWDGTDNFMPYAKQFGQTGVTFEFTLSEGANTSAGVYDKDGRLVRTLWSAVWYDAGTYSAKWDGKDDELNIADSGEYTIKVMSNNVKYEQDALLANNTVREKADTMMTSYQPISDMTLLGNNMYYADQYMENYYTLMYFDINDIHRKAGYFEKRGNRVPIRNANDGETVYWMMFETTPTGKYNEEGSEDISIYGERRCFIMGVDVSENTQVIYEYGQSLWDYWGANSATTYKSAIGYEPYFSSEGVGHYNSSAETGYGDLTVQQNGNFLAAIYGNRDFVRIIDKTTGQTLKDNALTDPTSIVFDRQDRIWAAYTDENGNYAISRFDIASDGTMTKAESIPTANCRGDVLAMAFSPDGTYLAIVFGDGADMIYAYNLSDWSTKWTYGRGEDYSADPTAYDDKFMFRDQGGGAKYSYLEFEGNDYLWVGDPGNDRNRKLYVGGEAAPVIADTIWFSRQHYACEVDANDPTRVFFGPKEFKIDYTKEGDASWTLAKNYIDIISPVVTENTSGMFHGITTMSNGRTYFAGVLKKDISDSESGITAAAGDKMIFELTDTGIRNTGIKINGWEVLSDGSMTLQRAESCNLDGVSGKALYRKAFSGFDLAGNPTWGEKTMVAFMSNKEGSWNAMSGNTAVSENGIVFPIKEGYYSHVFRTPDNMRDFRMGGFKAVTDADNKWLFRTAPAVTDNYAVRVFPRDGAVEINTWYDLSGEAQAYGDNVITHYRGEGLSNAGQCNIFYHYLDNGLLVGVFGSAIQQQAKYEDYGQELTNGNGFCWQMTFPYGKDADTAYIYQGGEARMSGVVRTKVTGLNSINIQEIPVTLGSVYRSGIMVKSYSGDDCRNTSEIGNKVRYTFSLPENVTNTGSAEFEAYIKVPEGEDGTLPIWAYSDGNIRIVYDNTDIISGSGIIAERIAVSSSDYKKLTVYITPKDGVLSYFSLKTEIDGVKTDIPTKYLYSLSEKTYAGLIEYDLLEDLPFDSAVSGSIGGWNFDNWTVGSSNAKTNVGSYDYETGSSLTLNGSMHYGENIYAERDLGDARYDLKSWEIKTVLRMLGIPNGYYQYPSPSISGNQGKYLDVIDKNGKIIARITLEDDFTLRINGQTIMQTDSSLASLSRMYIHELTVPEELKLYAYNGKITADYRGYSTTVGVYESGADWKSPKTLKISAFKECQHGPHPVDMTTEFITLNYIQYVMDTPCIVNFYSDDRVTLLGTSVVEKGEAAEAPKAERIGYNLRWDKDITSVSGDMDVYAVYTKDENLYKVNYHDENGTLITTKEGLYGSELDYRLPEKDGYVFLYWTEADGSRIDIISRQQEINVYAKWRKIVDAQENFSDITDRIKAKSPYMFTNVAKTTVGAINITSARIPSEGYALQSYTTNEDGTVNAVLSSDPYGRIQGNTGFKNEYIYARANNDNVYTGAFGIADVADKNGVNSKVLLMNGNNPQLNYNKFRLYFDDIDKEDKVTVSYDVKITSYCGTEDSAGASVGGFGDVIDTNCDNWSYPPTSMGVSGSGRIIKGRCDAAYGLAFWNSQTESWVTLVSSSDANALGWNTVRYELDMAAKSVTIYVNDINKGVFPFAMEADTINALEFNLLRNYDSSVYYLDNITVQNNR